jgi:hypothetical protein
LCDIIFDSFLSFLNLISAVVTQVVETALTHEHGCEVPQADWAVVSELVSQVTVFWQEITDTNLL